MSEISKIYKPEIMDCPFCKTKLVYCYAISNKLVYFSNGKRIRIKNLAYTCPKCNTHQVYVSQTANKLSFKGYSYSAKIVCMIDKMKEKHKSREEICDYFFNKNIEISDRNVDNLYHKFLEFLNLDYTTKISHAFEEMSSKFNEIRLSIDLITVCGTVYIIVYDFFTTDLLALKKFSSIASFEIEEFLTSFLNKNLNITLIATIRKDTVFFPLLKRLCPANTKFISYQKF
ncbi:MAG: hypothetical protein K2I42_00235 [Anaeroplasmataceae bacterium]|nr:hypothetical protein [Anaeroplasmataceae bacterium]